MYKLNKRKGGWLVIILRHDIPPLNPHARLGNDFNCWTARPSPAPYMHKTLQPCRA